MIKTANRKKTFIHTLLLLISCVVYSQPGSKKWDDGVTILIPELDTRFDFKSSADKNKAVSSVLFITLWQTSIELNKHPDPSIFNIKSYTCLKCEKIVSNKSFIEENNIEGKFPLESCNYYAQNNVAEVSSSQPNIESNQMQGGTYSYNAGDDGSGFTADRFLNSPCYKEIGFSPTWDRKMLDARYSSCENQKHWKQFGVGAIIALLIGIVGLMVWLSRRKSKNRV